MKFLNLFFPKAMDLLIVGFWMAFLLQPSYIGNEPLLEFLRLGAGLYFI